MAEADVQRFAIADLDLLFERLARAGFKVGPAGRARASTLITEFLARDALPLDAMDLARWLQPLFVTHAQERTLFMETVKAWARGAGRIEDAPPPPKPDARDFWDKNAEPPPPARKPLLRRVPRPAWGAIAAVVLIVGGAFTPPVRDTLIRFAHFAGTWLQPPEQTQAAVDVPGPAPATTDVPADVETPVPDVQEETPAAELGELEDIVRALTVRAQRHGFAPTLEELYQDETAVTQSGELIALPGDAESMARVLGVTVDRPLPLHRADVVTRMFEVQPAQVNGSPRPNLERDGARILMTPSFDETQRSGTIDAMLRSRTLSATPNGAPFEPVLSAAGEASPAALARGVGGNQISLVGHTGAILAASFSPDLRRIVTSAVDETVRIWDATNGRQIATLQGNRGAVIIAIAYSPDGSTIATGASDGWVELWDARDGHRVIELPGHRLAVRSVAFSRDGTRLISGGDDGRAVIWELEVPGVPIVTDVEQNQPILSAVFAPGYNDRIATASNDGTGRIWEADAEPGAEVLTLRGHTDAVLSISFSSDGARILTTSADRSVRMWNAVSGREELQLPFADDGRAVFNDDNRLIVAHSLSAGVRVWDIQGRLIAHLDEPHVLAVQPNGERVVVAPLSGNDAYVRPLVPLALQPIADEMQRRSFTTAQLGDRVRDLLDMPDFPNVSADEEAAMAPGALQALREQRERSASDEDIARAWALMAFDMGWPLNISDPPWPSRRAREPDRFEAAKHNAPWIVAGLIALGAIGLWLYAAFNTRGFLARRRPDDPGRVADLATEDRARRERVDLSLRLAARRLLERTDRGRQIDIAATVDATCRAGGFFTPISKAQRRIPEYLFLIDSRSRFDHDARRALDYVERLRAENVKADYFFFERAPDRVREEIGMPLTPIETITSQYATRRLVLVGDAAAMLESDGRVGGWQDTVKVWEERALLTTVPAAEWGGEEETVAQSLGMIVRPLSSSALADLPGDIRPEGSEVGRRVAAAAGLGERPLPPGLRESAHLWLLESAPPSEDVERMLAELMGYLGQHGFRWLSACAVYPAVQWDLTMALGWRLEEGEAGAKRPLVNEQRVALLSELPWMRAGQMPQWLRKRLIEAMSPTDRQVIRAFLGELLDRARNKTAAPKDAIVLSFSVEGGAGRNAFNDDVFVKLLTEDPKASDPSALEATRKVRDLLLPPLIVRLLRPPEFAVLIGGAVLAAAALVITPRLTDTLATGAWAPLIALALIPLLIWNGRSPASALWRGARDPITPVRAWWDGLQDRRRLRTEDRGAYFDLVLPGERRRTVALVALFIGLVAFWWVCLPVLFATGFVPADGGPLGIFDWAERQRVSLRQALGEGAFGLALLATGALALGWLTLVAWACLNVAQRFCDRLIVQAAPAPIRGRATTIAGVCALLTVFLLNAAWAPNVTPDAGLLANSLPALLFSLVGITLFVQCRQLQATSRGIVRLRAGLPEQPLARVEVVVNSRLPGYEELIDELRGMGLVVKHLRGVSLEAARQRYPIDPTRIIHIGPYDGRSFGFDKWRELVIVAEENETARVEQHQTREAVAWVREHLREQPSSAPSPGRRRAEALSCFVSYASADGQYSHSLTAALQETLNRHLGQEVIVRTGANANPQDNHLEMVRAEIDRADVFVMVVTAAYVNSRWCAEERRSFIDHKRKEGENPLKRIFVVRLVDEDVPAEVRNLRAFEFFKGRGSAVETFTLNGAEFRAAMSTLAKEIGKTWEIINPSDNPPDKNAGRFGWSQGVRK